MCAYIIRRIIAHMLFILCHSMILLDIYLSHMLGQQSRKFKSYFIQFEFDPVMLIELGIAFKNFDMILMKL